MKKYFLLGLLAALAIPAVADYVYADENIAVVAREQGLCSSPKIVAMIAEHAPELADKQWGNAEVTVLATGKKIPACWLPVANKEVSLALFVDEDGDAGYIPQWKFRKLKDA